MNPYELISNILIFICLLIIALIVGLFLIYVYEKSKWNNGKCLKCGAYWIESATGLYVCECRNIYLLFNRFIGNNTTPGESVE